MEGKGDRLRWMRCQPKRRTLLCSLSNALESGITANLSPALRAARVKACCSSEADVRAVNLVEGFRSPRNPSNPPHKAAGNPFQDGDGLRPAGLSFRERDLQQRALLSIETSSTAIAVPLPLIEKGISRSAWGAWLPNSGVRSVAALPDR